MKKWFFTGWSKTFSCKAREITRNEAYVTVRRNDEGGAQRSRWVFFNSLLVAQQEEPALSEVLVEVLRGNRIESIHRGSIAVVNAAGDIIYQAGDPAFEISMRSCAKPLQALPVIVSGAAERFKFTEQELALFCGSVSGQMFHVEAVRSVLQKIGLTEDALLCGTHPPTHRGTAKELQQERHQARPRAQ